VISDKDTVQKKENAKSSCPLFSPDLLCPGWYENARMIFWPILTQFYDKIVEILRINEPVLRLYFDKAFIFCEEMCCLCLKNNMKNCTVYFYAAYRH